MLAERPTSSRESPWLSLGEGRSHGSKANEFPARRYELKMRNSRSPATKIENEMSRLVWIPTANICFTKRAIARSQGKPKQSGQFHRAWRPSNNSMQGEDAYMVNAGRVRLMNARFLRAGSRYTILCRAANPSSQTTATPHATAEWHSSKFNTSAALDKCDSKACYT